MKSRKRLYSFLLANILTAVTPVLAADTAVFFVPQIHKSPFSIEASTMHKEQIVRSQFQVLKTLSRLNNPVIFAEGATRDKNYSGIRDANINDKLFPNGKIPASFDDTSNEEREVLFEFQAVELAGRLGIIQEVKATDKAYKLDGDLEWLLWLRTELVRAKVKKEDIESTILNNSEYKMRVLYRRETEALSRIQKYIQSPNHSGRPIVLVFGAAHQFEMQSNFSVQLMPSLCASALNLMMSK